ncbi:MAG TPA: TadE family protein [Terriglobales bacterium]|jgi:Flp pilus assembly protein TadG
MKLPWTKRVIRDTEGQEIAEAAFVLPILFLVLFAILWFARAYSIYSTLNRAANAAAVAGAQSSCATCSGAPVDVQGTIVNPILDAAHLDHTQVIFNIQQNTPLNSTSPVATGTIVDLSYPFGFGVGGIFHNLTIHAEARALQEN